MCVQHVIQKLLHSLQKKTISFHQDFFSVDHESYQKNNSGVSHLNQICI